MMKDLGLKEICSVINIPVHNQISLYPYSVFARRVHVHQGWTHVKPAQWGTCFVFDYQDSGLLPDSSGQNAPLVILSCCVTHS